MEAVKGRGGGVPVSARIIHGTHLSTKDRSFVDKDLPYVNKDRSFVNKDLSATIPDRSFVDKDLPYVNKDRSFVNKDLSAMIPDRSFVNKDLPYVNKDLTFVDKDRSAMVLDRSFVNQDLPIIKFTQQRRKSFSMESGLIGLKCKRKFLGYAGFKFLGLKQGFRLQACKGFGGKPLATPPLRGRCFPLEPLQCPVHP